MRLRVSLISHSMTAPGWMEPPWKNLPIALQADFSYAAHAFCDSSSAFRSDCSESSLVTISANDVEDLQAVLRAPQRIAETLIPVLRCG